MNNDLFRGSNINNSLINKYRPKTIDDIAGQDHLVGKNGIIRKYLERQNIPSMIFYGEPGVGKTSLAEIIAKESSLKFISVSAVTHGVKELKKAVEENYNLYGKFILFVDEIHHFNRKQQDFFLPYIENEEIVLIGATTENPTYYLIRALFSRSRLINFKKIPNEVIIKRLKEICLSEGKKQDYISDKIYQTIASYSQGDLRIAINILESLLITFPEKIDEKDFKNLFPEMIPEYDRDRDNHYNLISAFIKSMRGSDPDAAVYYLARMLEGGEDPLYIARRMIIFASEDIGIADPVALLTAVAAKEAYENVGNAEGWIPLANAAIYLAATDKSNSTYTAYKSARKTVKETGSLKIPKEIMFSSNLENGYKYPHDYKHHFVPFNYLPTEISDKKFYEPTTQGREKRLKERLEILWNDYRKRKDLNDPNK